MLKFVPHEAALLLDTKEGRTLVIPDLHLGFEKSLAERGINIPSQTPRIYKRLHHLCKKYSPTHLLFLGDIKHGTSKIAPHEWFEIPRFFERLLTLVDHIQIVPGNHDGGLKALLPSSVTLHSTKGAVVKAGRRSVVFLHGHAWPSPEAFAADTVVMGHNHFTVEFQDRSGLRMVEPVWLVARWRAKTMATAYLAAQGVAATRRPLEAFYKLYGLRFGAPRVVVMPTFNPLLGGAAVNRPAAAYLGPFFRAGAMELNRAELYLMDGTFLGSPKHLAASI